MKKTSIGISDIQIYLPKPKIDLDLIIEARATEIPKLARHLQRARRTTGQRAIRFPTEWEDTATLAASSAYKLARANPDFKVENLRYLSVGTESGIDHAKPVSAFVEGMLQQAGVEIPDSISSFQVLHACAGGTLSLLSVAALLAASSRDDETGIVICSDIARYKPHTTAEITQGAGAVSLLIECNPKLIELDLGSQGYCSKDVDDFFRPLGSKTAQVNGTYSMQCYRDTFESAFLDHCERIDTDPATVLQNTDLFALHAPFKNLPETALTGLVSKHLELSEADMKTFLKERGVYDAIDVVADVGNIYTGALYLTLAAQLYNQYQHVGTDIVGKQVLLGSYGSGNTMSVVSGRISARAPSVIERWDMGALLEDYRETTFQEYQQWIDGPYVRTGIDCHDATGDNEMPMFALETIREDGYREYAYHAESEHKTTESKAPVNLHQSA